MDAYEELGRTRIRMYQRYLCFSVFRHFVVRIEKEKGERGWRWWRRGDKDREGWRKGLENEEVEVE